MTATLDLAPSPLIPSKTATPTPPRVDLYGPIHKALRLLMTDTLQRLGRVDADDADELSATLAQMDGLLAACRSHLAKENKFVHVAIEARRPGLSQRVAEEHVEHLEAIAAIEAETATLRARPSGAAANRLYAHLARFVAENLEHMHVEETQHNAALWAAYTDAELLQIHQRILASVEPAEMTMLLRWFVPAMSPAERAAMLGDMQRQMPPEAMRAVLETVRPTLDDAAWGKLARALNIPAVTPGRAPLVVMPTSRPAPLPVLGSQITVLASNAATGSHEVTFQQGAEGSGPPPHRHPWDETFYVTRGQVLFECAGRKLTAVAGTLVHVPANEVHGFQFGPGGGEMIEIAGAGGHASEMFADIAAHTADGAPDMARLLQVLGRHGVTVAA